MKQYEFNVYVETLTIWAKDEAEAEAQYQSFFNDGTCVLHKSPFTECHCIEHSDEVGHTVQEIA